MGKYEGGYIGARPEWDSANRTGLWTPQSVYHRQLVGNWKNSNDNIILNMSPAFWIDASDANTIIATNGLITEWRDKSINKYHISQSTMSLRPSYLTNTVRFNGNQVLSGGNVLNLMQLGLTSFVVGKKSSGTSGTFYAKSLYGAANNRYALLLDSNALQGMVVNHNGLLSIASLPSFVATNFNILAQEISYNAQTHVIRVNGVQRSIVSGINWINNFTSNFRFLVGAYNNSNDLGETLHLTGDISEIIIFLKDLTLEEREFIEGYLAWKHGLQGNLSADHPYKNISI